MINKREGRGEGEENSPTSRWERYVKRNAGGGEGEGGGPRALPYGKQVSMQSGK